MTSSVRATFSGRAPRSGRSSRTTGSARRCSSALPGPGRPPWPACSPSTRPAVPGALGGRRRREGRAETSSTTPAGPSEPRAGGRSCSSMRCTASTRPSRTPSCTASRKASIVLVGATTENPFFALERAAAQPVDAVAVRGSVPGGPAGAGRACASARGLRGRTGTPWPASSTWSRETPRAVLTTLEVAMALAGTRQGQRRSAAAAAGGPGGGGHRADDLDGGRRRRTCDPGLPPRARGALRPDLGAHQERARFRPRRRPLLDGSPHRGGRGPALCRPAARDPRERGRRHGRSPRARGCDGGGSSGRVRRSS